MNHAVIFTLVGALIAWRFYRRVRRNIGRQKLRPQRIIVSLVLFCVASIFIVSVSVHHSNLLTAFGAGLGGGALVGFLGLRLTQFETTAGGHFYTPDTRLGLAISLLLAGRILYRMAALHTPAFAADHQAPQPSPLTYLILGITFGYFLVYYAGLFVHTHDKKITAL